MTTTNAGPNVRLWALVCLALAACASDEAHPSNDDEDGAVNESPGDGHGDGDGDGDSGADCSVEATDDSLPGVTVRVEGDSCTVVAGEDSVFRYRIGLEQPIDYIQPASMGCGPCGDSLISYEIGRGVVFYALLDVGCCPPVDEEDKTLAAESITGMIEWPGVQWRGPSDTSEPLGPLFPHGEYGVRVTINVPGKGAVIAELPISVVASDPLKEGRPCLAARYGYPSGDTTFPDPTSCNTCSCDDGEVTACTDIACPTPCPDGFIASTDCGECSQLSMGCSIPRTACLPECMAGNTCGDGSGSCVDGACKVLCD